MENSNPDFRKKKEKEKETKSLLVILTNCTKNFTVALYSQFSVNEDFGYVQNSITQSECLMNLIG